MLESIIKLVTNLVNLTTRQRIVLACSSGCVFAATVLAPHEFPDLFFFVRPLAFLIFVASIAPVLFGLAEKVGSVIWRNLAVPFAKWATAKSKLKKLKNELLGLDFCDVVELARARGYGNRALSLNPDSSTARRLLSKGIIVRRHQMVNYDASFQVDELAWVLVQEMQEFQVENADWLEGICSGKISLEAALKNSEIMLPVLHPAVKDLLQNGKKEVG